MLTDLAVYVGLLLVTLGAIFDLVAAIGLLRLPDFYTRLHAGTIGAIGGASLPLAGAALVALGLEELGDTRLAIAGGCVITSITILMVSPVASHALARAAYKSREAVPEVILRDALREDQQ